MDPVLLLEHDSNLRAALHADLVGCSSVYVTEARTIEEALRVIDADPPRLIVAELELAGGSGLDLLPELAERGVQAPVIFLVEDLGRAPAELSDRSGIEVVVKPIDRSAFRSLINQRIRHGRTVPPPPSVFTVADYLQLAAMTQRSMLLTLTGGDGTAGRIVIEAGQATWAGDAEGTGVEAFRRLAMVARAEIDCVPLLRTPPSRNLNGSLEHLLMEAARLADERGVERTPQPKAPARAPSARPTRGAMPTQPLKMSPPHESPPRPRAPAMPPPPASEADTATYPRPVPAGTMRSTPAAPPPLAARPQRIIGVSESVPRSGAESGPKPSAPEFDAAARKALDAPRPAPNEPAPPSSPATKRSAANEQGNKTMNGTHEQVDLAALIGRSAAVTAAAHAEADGTVLSFQGPMDAESDCAVTAFAGRNVDDVLEDLGLGRAQSWCLSRGDASFYVVNHGDDFVVAKGNQTKNPMAVLAKLAAAGRK